VSDDLTPGERRIGESLLNHATRRHVWTIGEYTVGIEPMTAHDGRANNTGLTAGGWRPSEAEALRACLDEMAQLSPPASTAEEATPL
jgi:hypothetical protein